MSKIKLKDFWKDGYKAVVCKTVDEAKKFQIESFKAGFILGDIKNISEITEDLIHEIMKANEGTWCWSNEGFFAGLDFYKGRGFKIYKFSDIEFQSISPVASDLIQFLADKDLDLSPSEISELADKLNNSCKELHPSYLERLKRVRRIW